LENIKSEIPRTFLSSYQVRWIEFQILRKYIFMSLIMSFIITHPLILVQLYWILYVMWKLTGQLSRNNPCPRWHLSSDFPLKRNTVSTRVSNIPSSYFTWKETKLALLSLAIVILNSWLQMLFWKVHQVFEFLI